MFFGVVCCRLEVCVRRAMHKTHQQGAPVEGEAEEGLRPVGDALHERVRGDEAQRGGAKQLRKGVELHKHP